MTEPAGFITPAVPDIRAVAARLSRICRWAGNTREFYSVAQHSVIVSDLCGHDPAVRLAGLLHDAHEAIMGDINGHIGSLIGEPLRQIKITLDAILLPTLGVDWPLSDTIARTVDLADKIAAKTELRDIVEQPRAVYTGALDAVKPSARPIGTCWPWQKAEEKFLLKYDELWDGAP